MRAENQISSELKELGIDLPWVNMPKMNLPTDYFATSSNQLMDEIANLDFWDTMPKNMPLEVPYAYFEEAKSHIATSIFIDKLPKSTVGNLPDGYFASFDAQLSTAIYIDGLPKASPQSVPSDYFEKFHDNLLKHEAIKSGMNPRLQVSSRRFNPSAMAASILFLLGIGFIFFNTSKPINMEQQVASLSASEIESYIQNHQIEFDADITTDYIDPNSVDIQKLEDEIYNNNLNNLSQDELEAYLL